MRLNNFIWLYIIILLYVSLLPVQQWGASGGITGVEQRLDLDARMLSLSGAHDALSDNVESIYYNPAGLSFTRKINLFCSYLPVWDNLTSLYFVGTAFSAKYVPIGIGFLNISSEGIPVRSNSPEVTGTAGYQDLSFYLSTAYQIWPGFSTGLRINMIYKDMFNYNDFGFGTDLSILWRVEKPYAFTKSKFMEIVQPISFGLIVRNVIPPSITLKQAEERYPVELVNSLSYRFKEYFKFLRPELGLGLNVIPEYDSTVFNMGLDLTLWSSLFVRTGYKVIDRIFTIGSGIKMRNIIIDYGMSALLIDSNYYTLNLKASF